MFNTYIIKQNFLKNDLQSNGHIGNMSICNFINNTYLITVRQFNYIFTESSWKFTGRDFFSDRNTFFVQTSKDFKFIKQIQLINNSSLDFNLLEDIRIVRIGYNLIQCSGTYVKDRIIQLAIILIKIDGEQLITAKNFYLSTYSINGTQKNWIPIENKPFNFIYKLENNYITLFNAETQKFNKLSCNNIYDMSGSSPLIFVNNKPVVLAHKRINSTYFYRFIEFNSTLTNAKCSELFKLTDSKIEFSCGMIYNKKLNTMYILNTENDNHTSIIAFKYI